jgi:PIN domain nuclease of toxin-antitoxin system
VIVLDTHVILWDALQPERLSTAARQAIDRANRTDGILFCDICLWEIAMLLHKGRLSVDVDYLTFANLLLQANYYIVQPLTPAIAALSASLPAAVNKDPADRLIAATAISHHAAMVTADENLRQADVVATVW